MRRGKTPCVEHTVGAMCYTAMIYRILTTALQGSGGSERWSPRAKVTQPRSSKLSFETKLIRFKSLWSFHDNYVLWGTSKRLRCGNFGLVGRIRRETAEGKQLYQQCREDPVQLQSYLYLRIFAPSPARLRKELPHTHTHFMKTLETCPRPHS